ncbi:MAG: ABC transporter permease subunit [Polyangiales bacterium]
MTALARSLRASSTAAALLGVGSVALAVHGAAQCAVVDARVALPPGVTLAAVAGTALAATLATTPLCVAAGTDRARNALSRKGLDLDGVALEALRALPAVFVGAVAGLALRAPLGGVAALCAGTAAMACVNAANYAALCEDALRAVPRELEEASLALGATQWFTLRRVTWPTAARGIAAAGLRATARLLGEGAPLALVLGGVAAWRVAVGLGGLALLCVLAARALREPSA